MNIADFDYHLPPEQIAQTPAEPRDSSRLLVLHRESGAIEHRHFRDIGEYLRPGDLLVANDSKVLPVRLYGHKVGSGGAVEVLLLKKQDAYTWQALVRPGRSLKPGVRLLFGAADADIHAYADIVAYTDDGTGARLVRFDRLIEPLLDDLGSVPLPPYITAPLADRQRYQTVYAREPGSAAAPTAGLHFTPRLLAELEAKGVGFARVTLHVGLDTFRPVTEENALDHAMHSEVYELSADAAEAINRTRAAGGRVVAVGTTSVRVLESAALAQEDREREQEGKGKRGNDQLQATYPVNGDEDSQRQVQATYPPVSERTTTDFQPSTYNLSHKGAGFASQSTIYPAKGLALRRNLQSTAGATRLYIYPGYRFRLTDAMITNFHLPRSTLLLLVSAFAKRDQIMAAYDTAVSEGYRFFSFGDAMLIID